MSNKYYSQKTITKWSQQDNDFTFPEQLINFCQKEQSKRRKVLVIGCGLGDDTFFLEKLFQKVYYSDLQEDICTRLALKKQQVVIKLDINKINVKDLFYFQAYYSKWVLNLLPPNKLKDFLRKQDICCQYGHIGIHFVWRPLFAKKEKMSKHHLTYHYYQDNFWSKNSSYFKKSINFPQSKQRDFQLLLFSR